MELSEQGRQQEACTTSSPGWLGATISSRGPELGVGKSRFTSYIAGAMTLDELPNLPGSIQKVGGSCLPGSSHGCTKDQSRCYGTVPCLGGKYHDGDSPLLSLHPAITPTGTGVVSRTQA